MEASGQLELGEKFLVIQSMSWTPEGRAVWTRREEVPCSGPSWSSGHVNSYDDEYGVTQHCPACTYGNGKMWKVTTTRFPTFDAPRPPDGWTPESNAEEILDNLYGNTGGSTTT